MQVRKSSRSVYSIYLHFVFVTKFRRKVISAPMLERMNEIFEQVCCNTNFIRLEFSGESNHAYALVDSHPGNNISDFICSLKRVSSRILHKEFESRIKQFCRKPVIWFDSYYVASTSGASIEKNKAYIKS
ncbi:IS200/IS605 family transposase [cyanobacterium TDX16]|nr:IS200/IS605 family transposase [cyanobacterium TDX16]